MRGVCREPRLRTAVLTTTLPRERRLAVAGGTWTETNLDAADGGDDAKTHDTTMTDQIDIDFEQITADHYQEEKPHETFTVTKETQGDELELEIEFRDGRVHVSANGAHTFSTTSAGLGYKQEEPALECGHQRINGTRVNLAVAIPEAVFFQLHDLQGEHEVWEKKAEDWLARQPLRFRAEEHEYKTGTHRTKYHQSAVVLKPNKRERDMTEPEETLYEAMCDEYGAADGYPEVPDRFGEGDVLRREEVAVGDVAERWREIEDEREEQERWKEFVAQHPSLRGAPASSEEVEKAFREADRDGERKEIAAKTTSCSEPSYQCNLDKVVLYATPDREVETDRIHTH